MSEITNSDFSTEDIKNSVEYRWHKKQADVHFGTWLMLAVVMFVVLLAVALEDLDFFWLTMLVWAIGTAVVSIPFVCAIIHHHSKNKYLLKHFAEFARYEVILTTRTLPTTTADPCTTLLQSTLTACNKTSTRTHVLAMRCFPQG